MTLDKQIFFIQSRQEYSDTRRRHKHQRTDNHRRQTDRLKNVKQTKRIIQIIQKEHT